MYFVDVLPVDQALLDDRVDDRHGERAVGAGLRADVPVRTLRRPRSVGVDDDDLGAELLGVLDDRPVVQVGADAVAGPNDNVLGVDVALGVEPCRRPDRQQPGGARALAAEGALAHRGAHAIEEGIAAVQSVHQTLMAEIAVGDDCLRPVLGDDGFPARGDFAQRLVPGDAFELLGALGADAAERIEQAVRVVVTLLIVLELHAQAAARHWMIGVAPDPLQHTALNLKQHRAGVGAVMRTAAEERLDLDLLVHALSPTIVGALRQPGRKLGRTDARQPVHQPELWRDVRAKRAVLLGAKVDLLRIGTTRAHALGPNGISEVPLSVVPRR